jgi:RecA-family ATPase
MQDNTSWVEPPAEVEKMLFELQQENLQKNRIIIRNAAYALTPRTPINYIIDKVISPGSVNVWAGKFGNGKTYVTLAAGVSVALGIDFLGMPTKQTTVLFIDEESGDQRLSTRLAATLRGVDGGEETLINFISLAGFNLLKRPGDAELLQSCIEQTQAGLVFIDALADIMLGGDENSVKDTQPVFAALRKIAENTRAAIVLIHHTNKLGEYRGSSAIPGAIDSMLLIEKDEKTNVITFKSIKNRDGEPLKFCGLAPEFPT